MSGKPCGEFVVGTHPIPTAGRARAEHRAASYSSVGFLTGSRCQRERSALRGNLH